MKEKINHKDLKHAELSASGSAIWINCSGSRNAQKDYDDKTSIFADEGILAHAVAEECFEKNIRADIFLGKVFAGKIIKSEMVGYVQEYLDYVSKHKVEDSKFYSEHRVDFPHIVKDGFGTLDSAVVDIDRKTCHIFDLKYGRGVEVFAKENTQAQLYALGIYEKVKIYKIDKFRIHIVQPRIRNTNFWDITLKDLQAFGEVARKAAKEALCDDAPRVAGEKQCTFCKARGNCKKFKEFNEATLLADFEVLGDDTLDKDKLTDSEKTKIINNKKLIINFLKAVEDEVFDTLKKGEEVEGYKLALSRTNRKWTEEGKELLCKKLGKGAYKEKEFIGVGEAEEILGKEEVDSMTNRAVGKPTLVKDSDKRKAIKFSKNN